MSEVLHANVFFFITGIAVIIISAVLCVLLYHLIRALRSIRRILSRIEHGTEVVAEDLQGIRAQFKRGGLIGGLLSVLGSFRNVTSEKEKPAKKSKKKAELKITDVTR